MNIINIIKMQKYPKFLILLAFVCVPSSTMIKASEGKNPSKYDRQQKERSDHEEKYLEKMNSFKTTIKSRVITKPKNSNPLLSPHSSPGPIQKFSPQNSNERRKQLITQINDQIAICSGALEVQLTDKTLRLPITSIEHSENGLENDANDATEQLKTLKVALLSLINIKGIIDNQNKNYKININNLEELYKVLKTIDPIGDTPLTESTTQSLEVINGEIDSDLKAKNNKKKRSHKKEAVKEAEPEDQLDQLLFKTIEESDEGDDSKDDNLLNNFILSDNSDKNLSLLLDDVVEIKNTKESKNKIKNQKHGKSTDSSEKDSKQALESWRLKRLPTIAESRDESEHEAETAIKQSTPSTVTKALKPRPKLQQEPRGQPTSQHATTSALQPTVAVVGPDGAPSGGASALSSSGGSFLWSESSSSKKKKRRRRKKKPNKKKQNKKSRQSA